MVGRRIATVYVNRKKFTSHRCVYASFSCPPRWMQMSRVGAASANCILQKQRPAGSVAAGLSGSDTTDLDRVEYKTCSERRVIAHISRGRGRPTVRRRQNRPLPVVGSVSTWNGFRDLVNRAPRRLARATAPAHDAARSVGALRPPDRSSKREGPLELAHVAEVSDTLARIRRPTVQQEGGGFQIRGRQGVVMDTQGNLRCGARTR